MRTHRNPTVPSPPQKAARLDTGGLPEGQPPRSVPRAETRSNIRVPESKGVERAGPSKPVLGAVGQLTPP